MNLAEWSDDTSVGRIVDFSHEGALSWLLDRYGGARPGVLQSVLGHAYALGALTVIVEHRYIDLDWRNEHSAFYTGTFAGTRRSRIASTSSVSRCRIRVLCSTIRRSSRASGTSGTA